MSKIPPLPENHGERLGILRQGVVTCVTVLVFRVLPRAIRAHSYNFFITLCYAKPHRLKPSQRGECLESGAPTTLSRCNDENVMALFCARIVAHYGGSRQCASGPLYFASHPVGLMGCPWRRNSKYNPGCSCPPLLPTKAITSPATTLSPTLLLSV